MSDYRKLLHTCGHAGCNTVIAGDKRYCAKHEAQHDAQWQKKKQDYRKSKLAHAIRQQQNKHYDATQRDKEASAFYQSGKWRRVRAYIYSRDGAECQACGNILDNRKVVDHIHPLKYAPSEKLDTKNLWLICYSCHYRKTKLETTISSQPNGSTKLCHLDRDWWTRTLQEQQGQTITMKQWRNKHNE